MPGGDGDGGGDGGSSGSDSECEGETEEQEGEVDEPVPDEERWVPYRCAVGAVRLVLSSKAHVCAGQGQAAVTGTLMIPL